LKPFLSPHDNFKSRQTVKNSQVQDPYSIFQVSPQQEEPIDLEKSIEYIIQSQNSLNQSINMLEPQLRRWVNANDKKKKTLPTQSLIILDTFSHIDENQESWYLKDFDQDSILPQNLELDQYQVIDKLVSFHFNKIELEHECNPGPQLYDSILIFESMLTPVSLPKLDPFSEPTLIPVSIDFEIEPPLLDSHISLMEKKCELNSLI